MRLQVGKCHLQRLLDNKSMSQSELARRIKVPRQHVQRYIAGNRTMNLSIARSIMSVLDCTIDDLYDFEPAAASDTNE